MIKAIVILSGTLSLFLGIIGVFTPGLPTTPFILLTAFLYVRSSPSLYNKLLNNRFTGRYLKNYTSGIDLKTMIISTIIMWTMILGTLILINTNTEIRILLISIGIIGTIFKIRYLYPKKKNNKL